VSDASGVTIVCGVAWTGVAEVLACDGFFEVHPATSIAASNRVNGVSHFMATVNRVALHGSIHLSAKTAAIGTDRLEVINVHEWHKPEALAKFGLSCHAGNKRCLH
jgi:hypothetical protein